MEKMNIQETIITEQFSESLGDNSVSIESTEPLSTITDKASPARDLLHPDGTLKFHSPKSRPSETIVRPPELTTISDDVTNDTDNNPPTKRIETVTDDSSHAQPVRTRRLSNGSLPKSGKPMTFATLDKKSSKSRGRPKRKALVAMYQSQISENKVGIKLKLKKSDVQPKQKKSASKSTRKRTRKSRQKDHSDSDDSSSRVKRRRRERVNNNVNKKKQDSDYVEPEEQSEWGSRIPPESLKQIFSYVVHQEGCLPTLIRLGKVCSLWNQISLSPSLWTNLDLSPWTKERFRTELNLKWIIENRIQPTCQDLNLCNWKVTNIQCVLERLAEACPNLLSITLSGWKEFSSEHLMYLIEQFKLLRRLDLSSINSEQNPNKSGVAIISLCNAIQGMATRLTHLYLAHNRLSGIPQIVNTLSAHCPNLILLDLSNVTTIAVSHGVLNVEKLQEGCQKLKVLRITNSHIILNTATLEEQMASVGFPDLEELSIASLSEESRIMTDEGLQRILKTSTKLKLLDVRGCARLTHDCLIRLPTWDLKHLFLSGCSVTRDVGAGLELIATKWAHSLIEFDLAWANVQEPLDNAIKAIAEKGHASPINHLNLCGSSVSLDAVKEILTHCPHINSINLASCRGLPRGVKRHLQGTKEIGELRENLGVTLKLPKIEKSETKVE